MSMSNPDPTAGISPEAAKDRLDLALRRLDGAILRLDTAAGEAVRRGAHKEAQLAKELSSLRQTHGTLRQEARTVSDRLDVAILRLQNVADCA